LYRQLKKYLRIPDAIRTTSPTAIRNIVASGRVAFLGATPTFTSLFSSSTFTILGDTTLSPCITSRR